MILTVQHFTEEQRNNSIILLAERELLFSKYPILQNSSNLVTYNRAAELLCHITKYPRKRWSFWAAFDFCVSIITTVGKVLKQTKQKGTFQYRTTTAKQECKLVIAVLQTGYQ